MSKTYSEKLKDPRWQRKRLEVMQRDGFTCLRCKSTDKTLHVHHVRYKSGRSPWEYEAIDLVTFCEDCHLDFTEIKRGLRENLAYLFNNGLTLSLECYFDVLINRNAFSAKALIKHIEENMKESK